MIVQAFPTFLKCNKIYKYDEIEDIFSIVRIHFRFAYTNRKHKYFDVPCAFDIETTSFYEGAEKRAIMYEWTFGIYGLCIIGRTWDEFISLIEDIVRILKLNINKRLVVYVHNLSYEFQWIRKRFTWESVFSVKNRTPLYALTTSGIEFRCSLLLSGYSLEKVGQNLQKYKVEKLVGALDYAKPRHSGTPLTDMEKAYCINDVKVVMAYIAERMEADGSISNIPLTKTGYVRKYCRDMCFYEPDKPKKKSFKRLRYREIMKALTMTVDDYDQLKRAFQGGFTHANALYTGSILNDVTSYDFTSSYPTVMIAEKFPMSEAEEIIIKSEEDLKKNLSLYNCLFDVEIWGLKSVFEPEDYISTSRCWELTGAVVNNGRIHSADHLCTTITECDYSIIKKMYKWDKIRIYNFKRYRKDYLPTDFVKSILKLYADKTTLKGVAGKEVEYLGGKEMLNSCYGMAVTDPCKDIITYYNEWGVDPVNKDNVIEKYNKNAGRFLYYPWGVWVTAYARRNLFTGIFELGNDYVYADTDSIKALNMENHMDYIKDYNKRIRADLLRAMEYHGIDPGEIEPETIKGVKKCLGVWDFDGHYTRFKTLGAKRYMVDSKGGVNITVAGLNKKKTVPYLKGKYGDRIFENFTNRMYIPPEHTGKLTHTYIDDETEGSLTDYTGETMTYKELSSVHLEPSDYSLSLSQEYANFIIDYMGGMLE